jgi:5''-nucleotidase/2'',3''-cyclic phosphodiesterase and related esterases
MALRLWHYLCLWLAAVMLAVPAASASPQRIVAVGDLHGDYNVWIDIARNAGLIDSRNRWIGGNSILVQTGDIVDRGPDSLKIIRLLQSLQKEAPKAGGKVIALLGNHEAMNVTGDLRYVDPGEFAAFTNSRSEALREAAWAANAKGFTTNYKAGHPEATDKAIREAWFAATPLGMIEHQRAWAPDGEVGRWIAAMPAVAKVGDSLFAHGGISASYANVALADINMRAANAVKARDGSPTAIINDPIGPLWYRGNITRGPLDQENWTAAVAATPSLAAKPRPTIEAELELALAGFGVKRLVIGHTPNLPGIEISHDGKLVRIDTGNSKYYNGQPTWLEIVGDRLTPHNVTRSSH